MPLLSPRMHRSFAAIIRYISKSCHNPDKLDSLIMMVEKLLDRLADFDGKVKDKCDVSVIDQIDTRLNVLEQRLAKQNFKNKNYLIKLMHSKATSPVSWKKRLLKQ